MSDLIERLEKTTGPDRELDALITIAVGNPDHWKPEYIWGQCREYTSSIDAALTLVPDGWRVYAMQNEKFPPETPLWFAGLDHIPHTISIMGKSGYPAIALCIVALRARALQAERAE